MSVLFHFFRCFLLHCSRIAGGGDESHGYRRNAVAYLWCILEYASYILKIWHSRGAGCINTGLHSVLILYKVCIRMFGDTTLIWLKIDIKWFQVYWWHLLTVYGWLMFSELMACYCKWSNIKVWLSRCGGQAVFKLSVTLCNWLSKLVSWWRVILVY